jgi:hypothetical protein
LKLLDWAAAWLICDKVTEFTQDVPYDVSW